ncbi:hypothetical protein [Hansschlegelia sp. KR7-227]|uniref:hypothetical protein n=1 Tax=Hansschlegelia sp. KR7-227 TaxID=3400914 RepID=UPI003C0040AE
MTLAPLRRPISMLRAFLDGAAAGHRLEHALHGVTPFVAIPIGLPASAANVELQNDVKLGILLGSLTAGVIGWAILRIAKLEPALRPRPV